MTHLTAFAKGSGMAAPIMAMIRFELPIKLESLLNIREHWAKRAKRAKSQRVAGWAHTLATLQRSKVRFPAKIRITRIAPKPLDSDNLAASAKHVRDGIADALGINDNDPRVEWDYWQEKGNPYTYSVRVEIIQ